jgi:hypothetical protein
LRKSILKITNQYEIKLKKLLKKSTFAKISGVYICLLSCGKSLGHRSSVVEHTHGKGGVMGSIPIDGSILVCKGD